MRYLGGKSKTRKKIAAFLESVRGERPYLEPFVGGAWVMQEIRGTRFAADGCLPLITMYKALLDGWTPPSNVSREMYNSYRSNPLDDDPLTAFLGFGCSFAGKWFGGFIGESAKASPAATARGLVRQGELLKGVRFTHALYSYHAPMGMLVYCDPPYRGTTTYGALPEFNHSEFWDTVRVWSKDNVVVVSEYEAPEDFVAVLEFPVTMCMYSDDGIQHRRTEKLFMASPHPTEASPTE